MLPPPPPPPPVTPTVEPRPIPAPSGATEANKRIAARIENEIAGAARGAKNLFSILFGSKAKSEATEGTGSEAQGNNSKQQSGLGEQKPKDAPSGTIGLDQAGRKNGWDKDTTHGIKDAATGGMAGGRTWIGVAPDGTGGINEGGHWSPQGHYDGLKP